MSISIPTGSMLVRSRDRRRSSEIAETESDSTKGWEHTPLDDGEVIGPALRTAIQTFTAALDRAYAPEHTITTVRIAANHGYVVGSRSGLRWTDSFVLIDPGEASIESSAQPEDMGAVDAVRSLKSELGVGQQDVLSAVGIKKRTFHSWARKSGTQPRVSSLGGLWALVDAVADLDELVEGPLQAWLHAKQDRLRAFASGRFDDLVDMAAGSPQPLEPRRSNIHAGIGLEVDIPVIRSGKVTVHDDEDGS